MGNLITALTQESVGPKMPTASTDEPPLPTRGADPTTFEPMGISSTSHLIQTCHDETFSLILREMVVYLNVNKDLLQRLMTNLNKMIDLSNTIKSPSQLPELFKYDYEIKSILVSYRGIILAVRTQNSSCLIFDKLVKQLCACLQNLVSSANRNITDTFQRNALEHPSYYQS